MIADIFRTPVDSMFSDGLWIIVLEMLVALALAVFIVWWTLPRRKRPPDEVRRHHDDTA
jgi:hypothetical protein